MVKKFFKVDLVPALRRLEVLAKGLISSTIIGGYRSVFKGRGLEFNEYRDYSIGDDASMIDWRASAKTGDILVRKYIEERDIDVFFLLDASSNMLFGSTDKLKVEYMIELVASLSHAVLEAGDNVGLGLFTDKIVEKIAPSRNREQFYLITKKMLEVENYGGRFDFNQACKFALSYLRESSILIILSDFSNLLDNPANEEYLKLITKKFDVISIMIRDLRDREMPEDVGQVVLQDPSTDKTLIVEPELIKQAYERFIREQENKIKNLFFKEGASFIDIQTDKSFVKPLVGLFRARAARLR